jgi:hypothetical protein
MVKDYTPGIPTVEQAGGTTWPGENPTISYAPILRLGVGLQSQIETKHTLDLTAICSVSNGSGLPGCGPGRNRKLVPVRV